MHACARMRRRARARARTIRWAQLLHVNFVVTVYFINIWFIYESLVLIQLCTGTGIFGSGASPWSSRVDLGADCRESPGAAQHPPRHALAPLGGRLLTLTAPCTLPPGHAAETMLPFKKF